MEELMKLKNDPKLIMYEINKRKKDIYFWGTATFIVLIIFIFICRKDSSVLMTLSSMTQALSFIIILIKVINFQNCSGISTNSLICFIQVFVLRISIAIYYSIDYIFWLINTTFYFFSQFVSLVICICLLYLIYYKYPETSDKMIDNKIPFYYLSVISLVLSILFKPYLFKAWLGDVIWIYCYFLECISIYPQIILFAKKKGQIENFTAHYIALQGFSTVFSLFFWIKNFYSVNDTDSLLLGTFCGYLVVGADIFQLIIMAYYYYLYFKSLWKIRNTKKYDI
jgi:ER lumen protein retaining receptor